MVHLFYLSLLVIPDIYYQLWCFAIIICLLAALSNFLISADFLINASLLSSIPLLLYQTLSPTDLPWSHLVVLSSVCIVYFVTKQLYFVLLLTKE
jgi:hypothetical protein